jgi:Xaa-Pro aminopeptidase
MILTFRSIAVFVLSSAIIFSSFSFDVRASEVDKSKSAIRVAPPAPLIKDEDRLAELAARRARVASEVGPEGVLVLFSAEPRNYTNDVDYEYRQENNLFYLTNLKQKNATLVLMPGNQQTPEILFLPRRNPRNETWNGYMYSPQDARKVSGVKEIWASEEFEPFINALKKQQAYEPKPDGVLLSERPKANHALSTVNETFFNAAKNNKAKLYLLAESRADKREFGQELVFAADWKKETSGINVVDGSGIFAAMRLKKSAMELKYLQHAIDITTEGFGRAMGAVGQAKWEYEVEAEVEYTFKRRNADYWGYPSIVGCGPNATTLHYQESQGRVRPGDLLLMDVGAEYNHYTADVTRTFPVNGKFSKEQADIYKIVYDAQEAAALAIKPGNNIGDVNKAATEVIKEGLLRLGLITDKNSSQYRLWFMHGTSHWLGMNVHDVGGFSKFEPGMVLTNEPGIYVREDALNYLPKTAENEKFIAAIRPAFEKYKNIGVRIEDDMLVTETGCEWMTKNLPRTIPEIEALMARASNEMRNKLAKATGPGKNQNVLVLSQVSNIMVRDVVSEWWQLEDKRQATTLFVHYH